MSALGDVLSRARVAWHDMVGDALSTRLAEEAGDGVAAH